MAVGSGFSYWSFGLYVSPLEGEFGWSRAEVSLGFSVSLLASGLISPFVGQWIDRRGPRSSILAGAALAAVSYVLLAQTQSLLHWYLFNGLNSVFRQMMFFIPFQTLVSRWFVARRGRALSILGVGFSMGGLLIVPVMRLIIDELGWRGGFYFSAFLTAAVFLPVGVFVVRNSPQDKGLLPDGVQALPEDTPRQPVSGVPLSRAIRLPLFWLLAFAFALLFFGMLGWTVHQIPFWEAADYSRGTGSLIVALSAGLGIVMRLALGLIADRIQRFEYAAMVFAACLGLAMGTLLVSTSPVAIAFYLAFWVIGGAGGPLIEALLLTRAFGLAHFGTLLGTVVVFETLGQIFSPAIAGSIFDSTGSYNGALLIFAGTFMLTFVLFALASRLPRPVERDAAAAPARD